MVSWSFLGVGGLSLGPLRGGGRGPAPLAPTESQRLPRAADRGFSAGCLCVAWLGLACLAVLALLAWLYWRIDLASSTRIPTMDSWNSYQFVLLAYFGGLLGISVNSYALLRIPIKILSTTKLNPIQILLKS